MGVLPSKTGQAIIPLKNKNDEKDYPASCFLSFF